MGQENETVQQLSHSADYLDTLKDMEAAANRLLCLPVPRLALASAGDAAQAQSLANDLAKRYWPDRVFVPR